MNSAVRVRPRGAAEVQPSIRDSSECAALRNPNGQPGPAPPPSSSQSAAAEAQRAVNTAARALKPVSEGPGASQRGETRTPAGLHPPAGRSSGAASGAPAQRASNPVEAPPPRREL